MHFSGTGVLPAGIQKLDGTCQSFPQALYLCSQTTSVSAVLGAPDVGKGNSSQTQIWRQTKARRLLSQVSLSMLRFLLFFNR